MFQRDNLSLFFDSKSNSADRAALYEVTSSEQRLGQLQGALDVALMIATKHLSLSAAVRQPIQRLCHLASLPLPNHGRLGGKRQTNKKVHTRPSHKNVKLLLTQVARTKKRFFWAVAIAQHHALLFSWKVPALCEMRYRLAHIAWIVCP
jgi:hypothetical protein